MQYRPCLLKDTAEIKLEVRPENTPAQSLYQSCGFVHIDTTTDSQGDWLVMVKCDNWGQVRIVALPRITCAS